MKKTKTLILIFILFPCMIMAQNVVVTDDGTYSADNSAMLDVKSVSKGFLVPRMDDAGKLSISNPATGLIIYQTDGTTGLYFNAGTPGSPSWQLINSGADDNGNNFNVALGINALNSNVGGQNQIAIGYQAMESNFKKNDSNRV